jgi:hypothetical protein
VFESPVRRLEKDWDWTGPGLMEPEIHRTAKNRNCSPVLGPPQVWKSSDCPGPVVTSDDRLACGTSHPKILSMSLTSAIIWWEERKNLYPRHHEMVLKFLTLPGEQTSFLSFCVLAHICISSINSCSESKSPSSV